MDELVSKVVLLGSSSVGKSSLAASLARHAALSSADAATDAATDDVAPTVGVDVFSFVESSTSSKNDPLSVRLQLWDVAGKAAYAPPDMGHVLSSASIVVWCFDPTSEDSLTELIDRFVPLALQYITIDLCSFLLIQTKKDRQQQQPKKKAPALGIRQHRDAAADGKTEQQQVIAFDALNRVEEEVRKRRKGSNNTAQPIAIEFLSTSILDANSVSTCRSKLTQLAVDAFAKCYSPTNSQSDEEFEVREVTPVAYPEEKDGDEEDVEKEPEEEEEPYSPPSAIAPTTMGVNRLQQLQQAAAAAVTRKQNDTPPQDTPSDEEKENDESEKEEDNNSNTSDEECRPKTSAQPAVHPRLAAAMNRLQHHERIQDQKNAAAAAQRKGQKRKSGSDDDSEEESGEESDGKKNGKKAGKKGKKGKDGKTCDGCCTIM